ncbi:MAG: DUF5640 domain-containing protein [Bacteroidales bacterium]|nr:DUF5640 domain-containing protein [Bacteroidales bacterium]
MRNKLKIFGMVVLMLTTVIFMSSCNKNEKNIVGNWMVTSSPNQKDNQEIWSFRDNGSCSVTFEGEVLSGEYSLSNNSLSITAKTEENDTYYGMNYQWDLNIDVLDKKEMSLSGTRKYMVMNGYNDSYIEKVSYNFKKK